MENPSKSGSSIIEIERKRSDKVRENDEFERQRSEVQVGGHPALRGGAGGAGGVQGKLNSKNYNIQRAKD